VDVKGRTKIVTNAGTYGNTHKTRELFERGQAGVPSAFLPDRLLGCRVVSHG